MHRLGTLKYLSESWMHLLPLPETDMRRLSVPLVALAMLATAPTFAQETADPDTQRTVEAADREDKGEWGWLGLLGLAGLLGLKRRDRVDRVASTTDRARI
jgi:hypothetical protein